MPNDPLSNTFAALADPTRRALLARLASGEANVNELAQPFDMSLQAVSKHLKVLERAGLITRGRDAQYRPCRFEAEPLNTAIDWIERHRQVWTGAVRPTRTAPAHDPAVLGSESVPSPDTRPEPETDPESDTDNHTQGETTMTQPSQTLGELTYHPRLGCATQDWCSSA